MDGTEPTPVLPLAASLVAKPDPSIYDYTRASAEYIRGASKLTPGQGKSAQIMLSQGLANVLLSDLRTVLGLPLENAHAGERAVGGGLRTVQADLSEMTPQDGLTLAVELKPVHLAVGRAIWNRFGDIRTFAVNIHLKFPFAVIGGVMTVPTMERRTSGSDELWKSTTSAIESAVKRFTRAGGRRTEADAPHLLEGIAVVVFDHLTGEIEPDMPPVDSGLRWEEFVRAIAEAYDARFGPT